MYAVIHTYRSVDLVLCPFLETHYNDTLVCTARVAGYRVFSLFCGIIAYALVVVIYRAVLECASVVCQKLVLLFQFVNQWLTSRGQVRDGSTQPEHGNNVAVPQELLGRNPLRFCSKCADIDNYHFNGHCPTRKMFKSRRSLPLVTQSHNLHVFGCLYLLYMSEVLHELLLCYLGLPCVCTAVH